MSKLFWQVLNISFDCKRRDKSRSIISFFTLFSSLQSEKLSSSHFLAAAAAFASSYFWSSPAKSLVMGPYGSS